MRTMKLNGVWFEVVTPRKSNIKWYDSIISGTHRDLSDCYAKPSTTKKEIFDYWRVWYSKIKSENIVPVERLSVSGASPRQFSLVGIVNIDFEDYIIYITKEHNRLIKVM